MKQPDPRKLAQLHMVVRRLRNKETTYDVAMQTVTEAYRDVKALARVAIDLYLEAFPDPPLKNGRSGNGKEKPR